MANSGCKRAFDRHRASGYIFQIFIRKFCTCKLLKTVFFFIFKTHVPSSFFCSLYLRKDSFVVCTDAGLSSTQNRRFNDIRVGGEEVRSFITTQSIKSLPDFLQEYALGTTSWHLAGDEREYDITKLDDVADRDRIFYKERWIRYHPFPGERRSEGT